MSMTSPFQMTAVDDAAHLGVIECLQVLFPNCSGLGACFRGLLGGGKQDLKIHRLSERSIAAFTAEEGKDEADDSDTECSTAEGSSATEGSDSEDGDASVASGVFQCPHCRLTEDASARIARVPIPLPTLRELQFSTEDDLFSPCEP
jgi:hypothetical protein